MNTNDFSHLNSTSPIYSGQNNSDIPPLKPNTWLWQSIVITLCCSPLFGIIALVFAVQVNSNYAAGYYEKAQRASKRAKTWMLVGLITGIIYYIVMVVLFSTGNLPAEIERVIQESQRSIYNY